MFTLNTALSSPRFSKTINLLEEVRLFDSLLKEEELSRRLYFTYDSVGRHQDSCLPFLFSGDKNVIK